MIQPYAYPGTFRDIPVSAPRKPASEAEQKTPDCRVQPEDIIVLIANYYRVPVKGLFKRSRRQELVRTRYMIWLFIRKYVLGFSLKSCGEVLGGYDHTTVLHGLRTIHSRIDTEERTAFEAKHIEVMIERSIKTLNHPA